ncbi:hypothetical protein CPAST_c27340 [Clostridium pasteurianum DSM 525 = ATCC 6013]|uniref:Uncharacterized protein n=1 Tax=Clostridium pasteurianum DSM 525 = ATCC 6013 TaxID=1262449 RepID=A0A0H3J4D5_CLOPA|nr:hypothetical protein [Clostridium pasteurianum]AJA48801.1 hypothetical protein CPAST_c27340 [Clostridium pasteurianum DSM 525 = ATCC 6013]AJA52789.1 hypothetical protein CLPA_c27340 [Clostridium pasteurianum DSM 525 = ATCC 6013]AOZ76020.1 hypothetical protein AQ983_13280 [Clostridium pasteurianum DSM 525 = ATCC 6013]AOZ79816.1 hypothetical protein AQ984_13275 [Clostridium pasteurianum]ELP60097.1 hypothetical protein F502_05657 [Clostridium pasteurianum DSM 525 = ATCC 6013]
MNISQVSSSSYFNSNFISKSVSNNTDTKIMDEINNESNPVQKEEDELLYQHLKSAGLDFTIHSLDFYKNAVQSFPPLNAPANVRKAYRVAAENSTIPKGMTFYMYAYQKETGDTIDITNNNVDGYLNLMKDFTNYFTTRYQDNLDSTDYATNVDFLNNFTNELSKYRYS